MSEKSAAQHDTSSTHEAAGVAVVTQLSQESLRARAQERGPEVVETFQKRPYLVWEGMPAEFENGRDLTEQRAIPEVLCALGPSDGATYPSDKLNDKYRGGGMVIQPGSAGELEAYPVTLRDINRSTRLSVEEALELNPELAELVTSDPDLQALLGTGVVSGRMKPTLTQMIRLSALGIPIESGAVLPGKGRGQMKPPGEDAYVGIGKDRETGEAAYWMINCDKDGLPANYMPPEAIKEVDMRVPEVT